MTDRERLIELIQNAVNGCARHWAEIIADYLLANGVIVPPCKVSATSYHGEVISETYTFTVEIETDNIIGAKEEIASALEHIGKVAFPKVERSGV